VRTLDVDAVRGHRAEYNARSREAVNRRRE